MTAPDEIVFLLDVDNTLLDNDRIAADLGDHLAHEFGDESRDRYWKIFEALRGASAPASDMLREYGFSMENVCQRARALVEKTKEDS